MIPVKLSSRLRMSAEMIEPCHCVADIGCDHAHTDIWLIVNGIAEHCIGMDVRKGPLEKALANLKMFGCEEQVELRLSDGFDALRPFEAECAVAAGMGGIVMRTILERGLGEGGHLKDAKPVLVLQPQSHIYEVRKWLYDEGYVITDENICHEDGKYYCSMKAMPVRAADRGQQTNGTVSETELHFGPVLLRERTGLFETFLSDTHAKAVRRLAQINSGNAGNAADRKEYFEKIIKMIEGLHG